MKYRKAHDKSRYDFRDERCIAAACWVPGNIQRLAISHLGGAATTGDTTACCIYREHHGCPEQVEYSDALERQRRRDGWRRV